MNKGWIEVQFEELVDYIQPTEFIVKSTEYRDNYKIPVLTAGKSFIKGYTNEQEGIFKKLPAIIFDDFTTASRFVNFPFKVKSSAMKILVPSCDFINLKYVFYGMQITDVRSDTHKRYWISDFAKRYIPLPPLKEQKRITDTIEELFSELDNGVSNLKLAQNQLKVYRQALLKYAFEGKLTDQWRKENNPEHAEKLLDRIKTERQKRYEEELKDWKAAVKVWEKEGKKGRKPGKPRMLKSFQELSQSDYNILPKLPQGWMWEKLGNVCQKIMDGTHFSPKNYPVGDFMYITAKNIKEGKIELDNITYITKEDHLSIYSRCDVQKGDVLYIKDGATTGRAAVNNLNFDFSLLSSVAVFRIFESSMLPKYLEYYLNSETTRKRMLGNIAGVAITRLTLDKLNHSVISVCSFEEQKMLVDFLEENFSVLDNLKQTIESGLQKSEALRQSILKKALEGKLVPQDPKDEPAEELLKRIQTEKKKYLVEQKQQKTRKPKNTKKMSKELSIEEVLKTSDSPMLAKDVWQKSKHKENIEDFYKELKDIQSKIKEVKKGTESLLSIAK